MRETNRETESETNRERARRQSWKQCKKASPNDVSGKFPGIGEAGQTSDRTEQNKKSNKGVRRSEWERELLVYPRQAGKN